MYKQSNECVSLQCKPTLSCHRDTYHENAHVRHVCTFISDNITRTTTCYLYLTFIEYSSNKSNWQSSIPRINVSDLCQLSGVLNQTIKGPRIRFRLFPLPIDLPAKYLSTRTYSPFDFNQRFNIIEFCNREQCVLF